MIERPLLTADELKSLPKGRFVVMKTGYHPMQVNLKLFFKWGITFDGEPYMVEDRGNRKVAYADKAEIIEAILKKYHPDREAEEPPAGSVLPEAVCRPPSGMSLTEEADPEAAAGSTQARGKSRAASCLSRRLPGRRCRPMSRLDKLYRSDVPHRAKLVYIYLFDRMDKEKKAWPGINTIAADLSLSRSTVKRAIRDLERAGCSAGSLLPEKRERHL